MVEPVNIKGVLDNFCHMLKIHRFIKINAEIFRQAKFDLVEAVRPFWMLLHDVLLFIVHGEIESHILNDEQTTIFVKSGLYNADYRCNAFFGLPSSMNSGSRELLIAFGWLVAKSNLISHFIDRADTPLFDLLINGKEHVDELSTLELKNLNLNDGLNKLLCSYRGQKLEWRNHRQMFNLIAKKVVERNYRSDDLSLQSFLKEGTVLDLFVTMCPKQKRELEIELLEKERTAVKCFIKWIENESLFWKWLSSVIDEKKKTLTEEKGRVKAQCSAVDEAANRLQVLQFSSNIDNIYPFGNCCETTKFLLKKLSTLNVGLSERKHSSFRQPSSKHDKRNESEKSSVKEAITQLQDAVFEMERRHRSLKEDVKKFLTLDSDDMMNDVIHLPMPRR